MSSVLNIDNLTVKSGEKSILENINLDIESNKITVILGPSGGGKTTLLKAINRMVEEDNLKRDGKIYFQGKDIYGMEIQEVRKNIGMVFQQPNAFPFSIYKNMAYALEYHGHMSKKDMDKLIEEQLKRVALHDEIDGELKKNALKLSGGQQQRLCIARALTVNPKILLLDEPCSALDEENTLNIEKLLVELKKDYTIILVTHNLSQAERIADKKIYVERGRIINNI